ncbi:Peroxide stress-activated histidine kinase [Seminavis robusta]|uniref:Peroxide stress-activated histidine kinase n=1 Tax=Seminavis robusta TaxID=568900 RepID=A0A9N8D4U9_9STRA|nr:Peroxide stress-activated histidine kinase [Seminavis robusta]|eukprot:Sro1_g000820.1 Peroxide stress-activated histidine kinase (1334) ;mRNA; r:220857-225241
MMAAAQAAAEAALKEALEREEQEQAQMSEHYDDSSHYDDLGGDDSQMDAAAMHAAAMHAAELEMQDQQDQHMMDQEDLRLLQAIEMQLQAGQMDMEVLEELLSGRAGVSPEVQQALLHMLAQQEQEQQLAAAAVSNRPDEHYLTVAQNGTILEATKMATGFPPDSLLMSSAYDDVYDEDLPGLLCVKSNFWDKGVGDVLAFLRRRTAEGDWLWLESKAVSYVSQPVPGIILHESKVEDEAMAFELNRLTRITAIVVQAVEAAKLGATPSGEATVACMEESTRDHHGDRRNRELAEGIDTKELLEHFTGNGGAPPTKLEQEMIEKIAQQLNPGSDKRGGKSDGKKESFDPFSMMEAVREGVRLDLGLSYLTKSEVKMIALVLSGKVSVDDVCPLVLSAVRKGEPIEEALDRCAVDVPSQRKRDSSKKPVSRLDALLNDGQIPSNFPSPPPISVINLSYTYIGNRGIELLAEVLYAEQSALKTIDVSFCGIDEKGFISLAKAIQKRKRKGVRPLKGLLLSGNYISSRSATEIGMALSPVTSRPRVRRRTYSKNQNKGGNETDDELDDSDSDEDDDFDSPSGSKKSKSEDGGEAPVSNVGKGQGLELLHLSSTSITPEAMNQLLHRLGPLCPIRELNLSSNKLETDGTSVLVDFLQGAKASGSKSKRPGVSAPQAVMPHLDRLDLSNNNLGDDGCNKLTRAIAKRTKSNFVELKLSLNEITGTGIETMMNKLLQHNLVSLSLDKNSIGDQGCQLVAASLQSMKSLARLNLGFNQIGSRGIGSLMRSLVACESITYLELSGNVLKISGAVALAFTLAQHPRLEELDLDDCCLGQAAQCHIVAGVISNRWVPMKRLNGFAVGPPMVEIGALEEYAQSLSNEECFRIRKDEQMKTILHWMESNRAAKMKGSTPAGMPNADSNDFLSPDYVSSMNEAQGAPSQNAYLRLLGWLSRIPFDEDELSSLQKYFYDVETGDGDKDGVNLKLRGDLLAALDSDVAHEIRDEIPVFEGCIMGSVGLDLHEAGCVRPASSWGMLKGDFSEKMPVIRTVDDEDENDLDASKESADYARRGGGSSRMKSRDSMGSMGSMSASSIMSDSNQDGTSGSERSFNSHGSIRGRRHNAKKPRITMFPMFKAKLEELKATAAEMIELEEDPDQQEVILTQYAEASLTILRQLRYHCMNSGLDGWRHGGLKRKVLIVDDSNVTRKLVSRAFEKANFIVDTAADGAEGVEKLKKSIYDIAFMDIDMPVMNGFEATKKLRQWEDKFRPGARQPICALTAAYVDDFERSELLKFKDAGLDVMESKPCNLPRLFKVVDDVSPMFSDLSISVIHENSVSVQ